MYVLGHVNSQAQVLNKFQAPNNKTPTMAKKRKSINQSIAAGVSRPCIMQIWGWGSGAERPRYDLHIVKYPSAQDDM